MENNKEQKIEAQEHFRIFKQRFKSYSKSELVALLWDQGIRFHEMQHLAKQLHKKNLSLKELTNEQTPENPKKDDN